MLKSLFFSFACCSCTLFAFSLSAEDFTLVKDGKSVSAIVVKKNVPPPVKYGAEELSLYLGKIAKAAPQIGDKEVKGLYNIHVGTLADHSLVKKAGIDPTSLKEDGFAITARKDGLYIIGQNPRGAMYGCYEIVKKYGGIRFLVPGDDGEYFTEKNIIKVPEQKSIHNPYLRERKTVAAEVTAYKWLARNNMRSQAYTGRFVDVYTNKRTRLADTLDSLAVTGAVYGGHILTQLMGGGLWSEMQKNVNALYKVHPEYFPLINGKRVLMKGSLAPNPCISNPALLDLMADSLCKFAGRKYGAEHPVIIGNNDTMIWCECAKCAALDDPAAKGTKRARSDRYWYMVNEIAKRVWAKCPDAQLGGWAYQDFWYPPTKVKPDPRLQIFISYNNQCWRHTIYDPQCHVNKELRKIMAAWKKTGHPYLVNREEIGGYDGYGTPGVYYLPSEKILFENFKTYKSLGFHGSSMCINSPYPAHLKFLEKSAPYYGKNLFWYAMWQICYLSSLSMWNPDYDFEKEYDTINRLYYGKAWDNGFREFRKMLTKYFIETPSCMGWGGKPAPLGRCLDQAGSEEKLKSLLEKALAAAKQDKDPRVLKNVLRDKEIFELTWLAYRKIYAQNFKELNVYKQTAPIKIDGILDEPDWKNANALSNFKPGGRTPKGTKIQQTYARIVYSLDTLYIAVECMEPTPEKIFAGKNVRKDEKGFGELGNDIELFYSYPDMGEKYYHLAINPNGEIIDAVHGPYSRDESFNTKAKFATKVLKDRWILEIAIPCNEIGMKCYDGASWKINIARQRKLKPDPGKNQLFAEFSSACNNGAFHGAFNFVNMIFTESRFAKGSNTAPWKNATFDHVVPDSKLRKALRYSRYGKWKFEDQEKMVPSEWHISSNAVGTCKREKGNYYIQLEKGYITQYYIADGKGKLKIRFRARGKGAFYLWTCNYRNYTKEEKGNGYKILTGTNKLQPFKLTNEWQTFEAEAVKTGIPTERIGVRFLMQENSILDVDDVFVALEQGSDGK